MAALLVAQGARAATLEDAQSQLKKGEYAQAIETCAKGIEEGELGDGWWTTKARAELATGKYEEALKTTQSGMERFDRSLELRLLGVEALRRNNQPAEARLLLTQGEAEAEMMPWRYADAESQVWLGRLKLRAGTDARKVLEQYYDKAKKAMPESAEPYKATGELALEKQDFAVAAEAFKEAIKRAPDDPDLYLGLARAYPTDPDQATPALAKALELNPRHGGSLLLQADNLLDGESYDKAEGMVAKALEINPRDARAWAYRAVIAHLTGNQPREQECRSQALASWATNPEVDYLIGKKLSENYRFAEGAAHQRQALAFDAEYRPAKAQLPQDLLRLGKEDEGWKLAAEVFKEDPYDVLAYNLVTLHDSIAKFKTLQSRHFLVRMDPAEASIWGDDAVKLLEQARGILCKKYEVELPESTIVEIFSKQKDFAIRTFGMPGGIDFLGVCFGPVVTVNSPATRMSHPSNWQAVVWHEFCHSVTLTKTKNKMPRWLSEGISVYEEWQRNAAWGQRMTPQYRELILTGGATPVSKLSSAFMAPPSPMHLMFAYYESSMVVQYIDQRYGPSALNGVLTDLGNDISINEALGRHTEPIAQLDAHFEQWLEQQANSLAPKVDWEKLKVRPGDEEGLAAWLKEHPNSFGALLMEGAGLLEQRKFAEAAEPLQKALALYPEYAEADGPYPMLAAVYREMGDTKKEQAILEQFVARSSDALDERLRLCAIGAADKDWATVAWNAQQALAINPLIAPPHQYLAEGAEALQDRPTAIAAYRTLLQLNPLDKAGKHFHLGRLLFEQKQLPEARLEVDKALEEAPRYREAHRLLLEIAAAMDRAGGGSASNVGMGGNVGEAGQ
jgi:tetratricopeptide (TPR) repeat protein